MNSHSFFAAPAHTLLPWTSNSIRQSDTDDILNHRYRNRAALPNSTVIPDQLPRPFFLTLPPPNVTTGTQPFRRPEEYRATATRIERALESANTALNDAQEALETRDTRSYYDTAMPPLVDLTAASPSQSSELHRHSDRRVGHSTQRDTNLMTLLNGLPADWDPQREMSPPSQNRARQRARLGVPIPDPTTETPDHRTRPRSWMFPPEFGNPRERLGAIFREARQLQPPPLTPQERERLAIQNQREARALWESNQQRRQAALSQRSRSRSPRQSSPPIRQRSQSDLRPRSSSSRPKSESPVESIDLTAVDEKTSAADVLAKHGADASASQKLSSDTGRTALTSYKCPVCMETPTDITATTCGHLFCHRCIIETLKWSEDLRRGNIVGQRRDHTKGVCPVCRTELKRIDIQGHKARALVPLSIMIGKGKGAARNESRVENGNRESSDVKWKGKGIARDESEAENGNRESSSDWMDRLVNLEDN